MKSQSADRVVLHVLPGAAAGLTAALAALVRHGLRRHARAAPASCRPDVTIFLMSAWGMGGTIRAAHNLAGHLAERGHRVELLSVFRTRDEPFFGPFPPASARARSTTAAARRPPPVSCGASRAC